MPITPNDSIYDGTPMTGWTSTVQPCVESGLSAWWILAGVAVALLLIGKRDSTKEAR